MSQDLAIANQMSLVRPVAQPAELISYHEEVSKLIQKSLTQGVDYGIIPGTGDKPTLLKPGAERLCLAFGASPSYSIIESTIDHDRETKYQKKKKVWANKFKGDRTFTWEVEEGISLGLYRYVVACEIKRPDGRVLGNGQGVCSTLESKYVDRPRDCENTILKMAQKRALVAAVLNAFGLSNRFTQDVEDHHDEAPIDVKPKKAGVYTGSPDQQAIIKALLVKAKVDESLWDEIDKKMMGKPSTALDQVIKEVSGEAMQ